MYSMSLVRQNSVVFDVKACSDVQIALSSEIPEQTGFSLTELLIGVSSNTQTSVRRDGVTVISRPTPRILSCNESRVLWIEWTSRSLSFGTGPTPGNQRLLIWFSPEGSLVQFISMAIATSNQVGIWNFGQTKG